MELALKPLWRNDKTSLEFRCSILQLSLLHCHTNYSLTMFFCKVEGLENSHHHFFFSIKNSGKVKARNVRERSFHKNWKHFWKDKISKVERKEWDERWDEDTPVSSAGAPSLAFIHTAIQPKPKVLRTGKIQIISHTKCKIFFLPTNFWTCMCACSYTHTQVHVCVSISLHVGTCMP